MLLSGIIVVVDVAAGCPGRAFRKVLISDSCLQTFLSSSSFTVNCPLRLGGENAAMAFVKEIISGVSCDLARTLFEGGRKETNTSKMAQTTTTPLINPNTSPRR